MTRSHAAGKDQDVGQPPMTASGTKDIRKQSAVEATGDLKVPVDYAPGGYALENGSNGSDSRHKITGKDTAVLTEERIAMLDAIGMRWGEKQSQKPLSEQAAQAETVTRQKAG